MAMDYDTKPTKTLRLPFIALLFEIRRPATVLWGVVPVVINAVNRSLSMFFFEVFIRLEHVVSKILKAIPSLANLYSTPAIVVPFSFVRIRAAVMYVSPDSPKVRPAQSMFRDSFYKKLFTQAATRSYISTLQVSRCYSLFNSALTKTLPEGISKLVLPHKTQHGKTAMFLTSQIIKGATNLHA